MKRGPKASLPYNRFAIAYYNYARPPYEPDEYHAVVMFFACELFYYIHVKEFYVVHVFILAGLAARFLLLL